MKGHLKTIITVAVTVAITFSITSIGYFLVNNGDGIASGKLDTVKMYIDKYYLYDNVDFDKLEDSAVKAYVESLDEPYTTYYTKDEFNAYLKQVEESYTGIGVSIAADMESDKIVVVSPIKNSPAYKAGVKAEDYIIAVDEIVYPASKMQDCVNHITGGEVGTSVKLQIMRDGQMIELNVTREEITEESVSSKMLDNKIGYISISSFNMSSSFDGESTYTEFVDAVDTLQDSGANGLIIDLRDNPGGVLDVVCDIADYLLPEGLITYTETRLGKRNEIMSDKHEVNIPMVVLINRHSASASEVLTGALKDHKRAVVVGERSYGKGIVQKVFPFSDGSGMSMTISRYYTPNGTMIHGIGIEPDYAVDIPEKYKDYFVGFIPSGEDNQLNKAIEILNDNKLQGGGNTNG